MTTQAQIDALRQWYAGGLPLINALTPDVPTPIPPPVGELYSSYNSAFLGTRTYYPVGVDGNGQPGNPPVPANVFLSQAVDTTHGIVIWGSDTEHHVILTDARGGGEQWGAVEFYGSSADPSIAYPEEVVKCDWTNLDTGVVRDMTGFTVGPTGGIMCPQVLPAGGNWRLRQWGWVNGTKSGPRVRPFYWQADYLFGTSIADPAWTKDSQKLRPAIRYSEAWWDSDTWVRGTAPTAPWVGTPPVPADVNVTYLGWEAFGKGAGTLWRYDFADYKVALSRS